VRCPRCADLEDRVVDSREVAQGTAVRRRRECLRCGHRFTTFERCSGAGLVVVKRSGEHEPFRRDKIAAGVRAACKNRPVADAAIDALARDVERLLLATGSEVTTEQVGVAVLNHLRELDDIAYLRFASVYNRFEGADDFAREVGLLLTKRTAPKLHGRS